MIILSLLNIYLQLPPGTRNPDDNAPLDLTDPFNVIVFIILPIAAVVLYFVWRKKDPRAYARSRKRHQGVQGRLPGRR